jgi:hypothetical protein
MTMLDHFHDLLEEKGLRLVVCGIEDELRKILTVSGLREKLGEQNIFYADNRIFQSTELALARARSLVAEEKRQNAPSEKAVSETPWVVAGAMANRRFLRFGMDHQIREALWLLSEMIKSNRAGPRPMLFLQNQDGLMANGIGLRPILENLTGHPSFHSHPNAGPEELASYLREGYFEPVSTIPSAAMQSVPGSADLPAVLAAALRNRGGPVPVLDEEGRMTGLIEHKRILAELTQVALQQKKTKGSGKEGET